MPKIKQGVSPPAKIHEFLVFSLESARVLDILLLQTQFKQEKKGALKERNKNHQSPKQNKNPTKAIKPKLIFEVRKERINYNPQVPVMVSGREQGHFFAMLCPLLNFLSKNQWQTTLW